jgi:hypothetical protein
MSSTLIADRSSRMNEPLLLPSSCDEDARRKLTAAASTSFTQKAISLLRFKFILAGLIFGSIVEVLLAEKMTLDLRQEKSHHLDEANASSAANGTTISGGTPSSEQGQATTDGITSEEVMYANERIQSFLSSIFWYELSFLYVDVLFIIYLVLLVKSHHMRKNNSRTTGEQEGPSRRAQEEQSGPDFALVVKASNWIVGMVIGVLVSIAVFFGPNKVIWSVKLLEALLTITLGIFTCIAAREAIVQCFEFFGNSLNEEEGAKDIESCKGDEDQQEPSFVAHVV